MTLKRRDISPDQLLLDIENPRFGLASKASQSEALEFLFENSDIRELWNSIVENGFLPYEPIIAWQPDKSKEEFVVIEGNRRLAAVKTLLNPALIADFSRTAVPEIPPEHRSTLNKLPVMVIDHRDDADQYIGFRHVNGARNWEPLPKARFGLKLLEKLRQNKKLTEKQRVEMLARQIGENPTQIVRNLFSLKVLQQAMELGMLADDFLERTKNDFSHLYSILSNPDTREYIGLGRAALTAEGVVDNPVPESHHNKLRHLITWLFGSSDGQTLPVITRQGTDRPALQKVIATSEALTYLEKTGDFVYAKQLAGTDAEDWLSSVHGLDRNADKVWQGASGIIDSLEEEDAERAAQSLAKAKSKLEKLIKLLS